MKKKIKDTYSYKGWIISDNFLKRTLAITGYELVGRLIISFIFIALVLSIVGIALFVNNLF